MKYDFNGKSINIPDKDLSNLMKTLDLTKEEAIETWLDDNDYTTNEQVEELTAKAKKEIKRYEKADKPRKNSTKERKVDEDKGYLLGEIKGLLGKLDAEVTNVKNEAEISFLFNGDNFSLKLIRHRPPKK